MRNDFDDEREDEDDAETAFLKGKKSSVLEADESEESDSVAADDDVFESVENPFDETDDSESGFAVYSSDEDDLGLQF